MVLAKNIKRLRNQHGLTQKQLAQKLHLNRTAISNYETEKQEPSITTILKIAEFFNISIDDLISKEI